MQRVDYLYFIYMILSLESTLFLTRVEAMVGEKVRAAGAEEYPFVVSIGQRNSEMSLQQNHICTGTIISDKHVLTAAHCLNNRLPENVQVTYGTIDLLDGNRYNVASWLTYTEWASVPRRNVPFEDHDIAVLTLSERITQCNVMPARLSSLNGLQIERSAAAIVGFGNTNSGVMTRFLLTANVTILSRQNCNEKFRLHTNSIGLMPENQVCSAAEPYVLIRAGDSGGPLLNMRNELVGINLGTCPLPTWYEEPDCEDFLMKYKFNAHLLINSYRRFISNFQ